MFLLALFLYQEPVQPAKLLTFACIWSALGIFSAEGWYQGARNARMNAQKK